MRHSRIHAYGWPCPLRPCPVEPMAFPSSLARRPVRGRAWPGARPDRRQCSAWGGARIERLAWTEGHLVDTTQKIAGIDQVAFGLCGRGTGPSAGAAARREVMRR